MNKMEKIVNSGEWRAELWELIRDLNLHEIEGFVECLIEDKIQEAIRDYDEILMQFAEIDDCINIEISIDEWKKALAEYGIGEGE